MTDAINLSELNGSNGFTINGIDANDQSGFSVSDAGDVNGDGINDVIIGANQADPNGNIGAGESYVVFGSNNGFDSRFDLASLNGNNGFAINGINQGDQSGHSVSSAGDVNGDGIDDIIIGTPYADTSSQTTGASYVVFGSNTGFAPSLNLLSLNGSNGFVIEGIDFFDQSGFSVSDAGDVNGDGFDDLIIGARNADPNGLGNAGESYVVFGRNTGFDSRFDLANLDGTNGFVLNGINSGDRSGFSVSSAGDVNGDDIDDLIIGAYRADSNGNSDSGESYVVFGRGSGFDPSFNLSSLDGNNGFVIEGIDSNDHSGRSVSSAGDVNGDGFDDVIIGAYQADPNGNSAAGESYVVFGRGSGFDASFDVANLNGNNGFIINGVESGDRSGFSVSGAGDVNRDGFDDLIIGASSSTDSYVVFGQGSGFDPRFDLSSLDGSNGFTLNGVVQTSGNAVSTAGDVNGDGVDDLIIGARSADPNGIGNAGESYVVFGLNNNTAPDAVDDAATTDEDNPVIVNVLVNDTDPDGDSLTVTEIDTTGTIGFVRNDNGLFFYDPNGQFDFLNDGETATDSFTYTIDDGNGGTDTATVTITINGITDINRPPNAVDDTATTDEENSTTVDVLANDSDPDGDSLTVTEIDTTNTVGIVIQDSDSIFNRFTYDPNGQFAFLNPGETATDSFTYTIDDGNGGTDTATVNITIRGTDSIGDIPDTTTKAYTAFRLDASNFISDPDGDPLTYSANLAGGEPLPRWLSLDETTGVFSGLPVNTHEGTLSIEVTADDNNGGIFTDNFNLTIERPLNPTANIINGDDFSNNLFGTDANDKIRGRGGDDTLDGGNGDDNLFGQRGLDTISGGDGADFIDGGGDNDFLTGGNQDDILVGGGSRDQLQGEAGNDTLDGSRGVDQLSGGEGADVLIGGPGLDILFGNGGNDQFVLSAGQGRDTIKDYQDGQDTFLLTGGLSFTSLEIIENTAGNTIIRDQESGVLAILEGVSSSVIDVNDFSLI